MLAQALPQIARGANVEMTGYSLGFENVNVVHRYRVVAKSGWSAFALRVGRVQRAS